MRILSWSWSGQQLWPICPESVSEAILSHKTIERRDWLVKACVLVIPVLSPGWVCDLAPRE